MHLVVLQTQQVLRTRLDPGVHVQQGPYEVGYAYDCQSAGCTTDVPILDVADRGATSSVLSSRDLQGSGTVVVSAKGDQKLKVETAPACQWVMKVVAP